MTITNGASAKGGAIYARGDLILEDVVVSGSSSTSTGGGIYAKQDLSLLRSSVTGNQATDNGGGIYATAGTSVTLTESLIAGNSSGNFGGGLFTTTGTVEAVNTTFSSNSAKEGGALYASLSAEAVFTNVTVTANTGTTSGGGLANDSGTITLRNTIVAGNLSDTDADLQGAITSEGNNLIGIIDTSTGITDGTKNDQAGTKSSPVEAGLTSLGDYGGSTLVHSLTPGSLAIDQANDFWAPDTDQRGKARPLDGDGVGDVLPDIGAMEFKLHSEIHGVKYHDRNENGVQDEGEEGLAGWVMYLDANDNGVTLTQPLADAPDAKEMSLSSVIGMMNPPNLENVDEVFVGEVARARQILQAAIAKAKHWLGSKEEVHDALAAANAKGLKYMQVEGACKWPEHLHNSPDGKNILYVVYPAGEQWYIRTVPAEPGSFDNRQDLPKSWAGLRDEEFSKEVGIDDGVFCHHGLFICAAQSYESIIKLVEIATAQ